MEDLSLHILDIAENSITAEASVIRIGITEDVRGNLLVIDISDNGRGMDGETVRKVHDPFFTTKTVRGVGLGVPLLAQAARECNGTIKLESEKGKGTSISARFQYDHIDRKPLGDMEKTLVVLVAAHPQIDFVYEHRRNGHSFIIDTREIKGALGGIPVNAPEVIKFIKDGIRQWLNETKSIIVGTAGETRGEGSEHD